MIYDVSFSFNEYFWMSIDSMDVNIDVNGPTIHQRTSPGTRGPGDPGGG